MHNNAIVALFAVVIRPVHGIHQHLVQVRITIHVVEARYRRMFRRRQYCHIIVSHHSSTTE